MISPDLDILETTLRDGSYLVDFRFTARDTAWLAARLEECGINFIEIGHGLGLGASAVHGQAAASDADYIEAACGAVRRAKIGVFAIPGVASLDDIAMAADLGLDFVRVGADLERIDSMAPFVEAIRNRGMFACTNFMKSYGMPPANFAQICKRAEDFGTQMNYVVDSAGGMLPDEVGDYFDAVRDVTSVPYGFHGHDNTRLAIANSLMAVERGAMLVDTTLFGVGRGSGNAATELISALVKRKYGVWKDKDELRLVHLAESEAVPLLKFRHQETISSSLGLAKVHSMFLDRIVGWAKAHDLDPHALISSVGEIDMTRVNDAILEQAARRLSGVPARVETAGGTLEMPETHSVEETVRAAENLAEKLGIPCTLWITEARGETRVRVRREEDRVEVCISGDPKPAVRAATRPVTRVRIDPSSGVAAAEVGLWTNLPAEAAERVSAWVTQGSAGAV